MGRWLLIIHHMTDGFQGQWMKEDILDKFGFSVGTSINGPKKKLRDREHVMRSVKAVLPAEHFFCPCINGAFKKKCQPNNGNNCC